MRAVGLILMLLATGSQVAADGMSISYDVGLIVGTAPLCGFKLDEDAVSAFLAANIPAEMLDFPMWFNMHKSYHRREFEEQDEFGRRLYCEAVERSARTLNFLK